MIAKLYAFLRSPGRTFAKYPETDTKEAARYARAIAHFEAVNLPAALVEVDSLLAEAPNDPFFHELRGQILFESGRPDEALPSYRQANALLPGNGLLEVSLARVLLSLNDEAAAQEALGLLESAIDSEGEWAFTWRQLAIAYGRLDRIGDTALALAEEAIRRRDYRTAEGQARLAQAQLPTGSAAALRALDIEEVAKREQARRN